MTGDRGAVNVVSFLMEYRAKPDDLSPFERLNWFARAIVAVPKAEIAGKKRNISAKNVNGVKLAYVAGSALLTNHFIFSKSNRWLA
jgi:hypothetical protein